MFGTAYSIKLSDSIIIRWSLVIVVYWQFDRICKILQFALVPEGSKLSKYSIFVLTYLLVVILLHIRTQGISKPEMFMF